MARAWVEGHGLLLGQKDPVHEETLLLTLLMFLIPQRYNNFEESLGCDIGFSDSNFPSSWSASLVIHQRDHRCFRESLFSSPLTRQPP